MQRYNFTNPLFLLKIDIMIRRFFAVFALILFTRCDDGDIITVNLEFEGDLEFCDNNIDSFLIYDTREDPNETLSIIIPRGTNQDLPFVENTVPGAPLELPINGSTTRFIYRTYNRAIDNQELCEPITPSNLIVQEDYEASDGTIVINVTVDDDDGDGIPSDLEGRGEPDENGLYSNAQDWDGDGIPDYQDQDDDNDNVPTRFEIDTEDLDGDGDPTTNPLNTDANSNLNPDNSPNYLDIDDDGDGIPTAEEDEDGNMNPTNDVNTNTQGELVPHYLNELEAVPYPFPGLTTGNQFNRTIRASFAIINFNLEILSSEELDFGDLIYEITITEP
ncbi:hypothetical protein [uncultured Winogradskyella sp.]|uniref:hypothetical protein n=1 Tax=uncultured Winogradskyella sp. TaxID=395353 RepID=UPI002604764A|nr:hypothetical protein [uncultured Winogradskyella sp.]